MVQSYATQNILYFSTSSTQMYTFSATAGQNIQLTPAQVGGTIASGDYICGLNGSVSAVSPGGHKDWTPTRLRGRTFVQPTTRHNNQVQ